MLKPLWKISRRTMVALLETAAVLAILLGIAFGIFMWKLSQGPISIGWAKDYVEEALSDESEELYVRFDNMVFTWPELQGPFQLDLANLKVQKGKSAANSLSIERAQVGLSRAALFFGRIRPVSVVIQSPSLELVRSREGTLSLFVKDEKEALVQPVPDDEPKTDPGQQIADIFKDMATHKRGSFISRLDEFLIKDASVAIRDYEYGLSWYLTDLDFGIAEHPQGVAASLDVDLPGGKEKPASITIDMVYRTAPDDFRASAHIQDLNPYFLSRFLPVTELFSGQNLFFTGDIKIAADSKLVPVYAVFTGAVPAGTINVSNQFDAPIALKNIAVKAEYKSKEDVLSIPNLSGEIGGIAFKGEARGITSETSVSLPIELKVENKVDLKQLVALFPKSEHDGEAYEWLGGHIKTGAFTDVGLKMEVTADKIFNAESDRNVWSVGVPRMNLDFAFDNAEVHYSDTLMPVTEARGRGSLDLAEEVLTIEGDAGKIGDLEGRDVKVVVTDLMKSGAGYVTVDLKAKGPVATALSYIAAEPIGMDKERLGIDAATVKGTIDAVLHIALPTIKDVPKEDVIVEIEGTMSDLTIPAIVEGLTLSGGPLNLKTEKGGFRIKGDAQLAGRPTKMEWHQFFESAGNPYSMQIQASIGADSELRRNFGINLDEYIDGTMPVDVLYTSKGDGTQSIDIKGDLTPVNIIIDPLNYVKRAGTSGTISAKAALVDNVLKDLSGITVTGQDFSVKDAAIKFAPRGDKSADIESGTLPNAVVGKTKATVTFNVDKNNVMKVAAKASVFDLAPILTESEASTMGVEAQAPKEKQQAMAISLTADTMLGAYDQQIKGSKIYLETDTDGDITRMEMDGAVGKGQLFVRFRPDDSGVRTFRLEATDAGAVLKTFGLYENIVGGKLLIYGEPKGGDLRGDLFGSMRMENIRVVRAPALAKLLSLMSLGGIGDLLRNQGVEFSKLESDYEWRFRPAGNLLIIKDGKTSGSSVGLTFEGVLDRGKKTTDISGTIIPMTEINSFIAKIPLLGNILGGETGLIAATYTMKGPSNKPSVMVNPLSVLAPGFLRNILFEGGYKSKIPDDPVAAPKKEEAKKSSAKPVAATKAAPNSSPKPTNSVKATPAQPKKTVKTN